jgi:geranylgeranyl pyrophosphate synthase
MHADHLARLLGVPDLGAKLGDVERCREHALDSPTALAAPSRRVTDAGGKRLRPARTIACAGLGGIYDQRVVAAATAAELVQVGSLVHDDLLDGALTRRGTPTINALEGASTALPAGDFILAQAGQLAASVGAGAASILARTISELCIGQTREMAQLSEPDRMIDEHLESIRGKTAMLFRCACALGALCAELADEQSESLARYGEEFGMAFQVLDDVLDLVGDAERLGKPIGVDIATGVYTMPVLLALEGDDGEKLRTHLTAGDTAAAITCVIAFGSVGTALGAAETYARSAATAAESLQTPSADALAAFAHSCLPSALEAFVQRLAAQLVTARPSHLVLSPQRRPLSLAVPGGVRTRRESP